eukprot:TRINITY_DN4383_c0_g3_i2.p1 TRINITY_DN4383_c0_g3~~TRINITY_DN4383_c0_g3_i2.p1  ORF type:complete len:542 (-),score=75.02 TRINITY_DN4383_c0_g3_i2:1225-2850(-)
MSESRLQKKLRELGLSAEGGMTGKKCTFKLYFPRPPHEGIEYKAAKCAEGYNFVGLVLGHGGSTLQKVQKTTGAKIEIHDQTGNLNGSHPDLLDPSVHALIITDTPSKLEKAARMISDTLQPVNGKFQPFAVKSGGAATLTPIKKSAPKKLVPLVGDIPKSSQQSISKSDSASSESQQSGAQSNAVTEPANVWNRRQQHPFLRKSGDLDQQQSEDQNMQEEVEEWCDTNDSGAEPQYTVDDLDTSQHQASDQQPKGDYQPQHNIENQLTNQLIENGRDPQSSIHITQVDMNSIPTNSNSEQTYNPAPLEGQGWSSWNDNQHQFFAVLQNALKNTIDNVTQTAALDGDKRFDGLPSGGPFPQYTGKNKAVHNRASSDGSISLSSSSAGSHRYLFAQHSATFPQASFPGWSSLQNEHISHPRLVMSSQPQSNRHQNGSYSGPLLNGQRGQPTIITDFDKGHRNSLGLEGVPSGNSFTKVNNGGIGSGGLLSAKLGGAASVSSGKMAGSLQQQQLSPLSLQQQQQSHHHNHQTVTPEHFAFLQH